MTTYFRIDADGYLNGVDTEPRDAAIWLTVEPPQVAEGQFARWTGSEWEVVETPPPSRLSAHFDRLWREAWAWGDRQFAEPDRTTVLGWLAAGKLSPAGAAKWAEVIAWHDTVFGGPYATAKAAITAAGTWVEPDWSSWPPCPHTFYGFLAERI